MDGGTEEETQRSGEALAGLALHFLWADRQNQGKRFKLFCGLDD